MNLTPAEPTVSGTAAATPRPAHKPGTGGGGATAPAAVSGGAPTLAPGVASVTHLTEKLAEYMGPSDLKKVKEAYRFSDEMHLGQVRRSGEPYISHPIAVAEICAGWKLDAQAIMAALLHDVMEDQDVKKDELIE
ncbi:MAG: HD domain-containing protein, partial [Pseudomonadota bacterium]